MSRLRPASLRTLCARTFNRNALRHLLNSIRTISKRQVALSSNFGRVRALIAPRLGTRVALLSLGQSTTADRDLSPSSLEIRYDPAKRTADSLREDPLRTGRAVARLAVANRADRLLGPWLRAQLT